MLRQIAYYLIYDFGFNQRIPKPPSKLTTSLSCREFIRITEGKGMKGFNPYVPYYATAHEKSLGILTVGWGSTSLSHPQIKSISQRFTSSQIETMFEKDIERFEDVLRSQLKVNVTQGIFDALVSATYNLGPNGIFQSQYKFPELLNAGKFEEARYQFDFWKQDGQVLKGLVKRRMAEHAMYLGKAWKHIDKYEKDWEEFQYSKDSSLL